MSSYQNWKVVDHGMIKDKESGLALQIFTERALGYG